MNWCMAPMYDDNDKMHLYYCRWPKSGRWTSDAQIVHTTAPVPEGPYANKRVIFADDEKSYFNPQLSKVGDTYILVYAYVKRNEKNKFRQKIAIATAKSLDGPWKQSSHNPVIAPQEIPGREVLLHASNPTFVRAKDGQFRIYFKSSYDDHPPPYLRTISLATSENIDGPYMLHEVNPLIDYTDKLVDIEDPYAFYYKDKYYMILEDRMNVAEAVAYDRKPDDRQPGGWRPGLIYESKDGIVWSLPQIGYQQNSYYFDEETRRFERPHILWKAGKPEYIFFALDGGKYNASSGAFLKIENW